MPSFLHPDKLIALNELVTKRPQRPVQSKPTTPLTPQGQAESPNVLADMAFRLHDQHWQSHFSRVARLNGAVQASAPATQPKEVDVGQTQEAQPAITIQLAPPRRNA